MSIMDQAPSMKWAMPHFCRSVTEDFDTADLKDAKALLAELN